jgi:hypothetical protein
MADLPPDATIRSEMHKLGNRKGYIRGVFGRVHECKTIHGNATVRIGVEGKGLMPYYRVLFVNSDDGAEVIFGAFYGDSHAEFKTDEAPNKRWSSASMTYDEVEQLLGEIRNFKRKKP